MVHGCSCFILIIETIFPTFLRVIILKVGSLTSGTAWPPQCYTVPIMTRDTEQMGQPKGCRIGVLLMRPSRTGEKKKRSRAISKPWWDWKTLKLLINTNNIGGHSGTCCSLRVTMGVARSIAVNLNSKKVWTLSPRLPKFLSLACWMAAL